MAACLILAGDPRAANQAKRTRDFQALQRRYNQPPIERVPVNIQKQDRSLLSYLGVRHIAAAQPWDSFAKAAWVSHVLESSDLTLEDVSEMIGDQHRTIARTLEGYYFVNQLIEKAEFNPADSLRPGRGSNPEYPFSWVYTTLGYAPIREWLELNDLSTKGRDASPITKPEQLAAGGELMAFLFGNKSKGRTPAISDSREISDLAKAIANPAARRLLTRGKSVSDVQMLLKPAKERIFDSLLDAQESLKTGINTLSEGDVQNSEAEELLEPSRRVRNLATEVHKKLNEITQMESED